MNSSVKKSLLVGFVLVSIIVLVWYSGVYNYFTFASLKANRAYFQAAVQQHYWRSVLTFIGIYLAVIALLIPGMPPLTMVSGFLYGLLPGVLYAGIGAAGGATLSFLAIRYMLSNLVRGKYAQKLERFNEKIAVHGAATYLLTMQLIGVIPYFIITTLAALANVSLFTFFWTTFVGSLPMLVIYTFAGRQLNFVESVSDIFSPSIILVLVILVAVSLLPLLLKFSRRVDLE
jgi:uncharacterized membrane protein YdjX (TVP38/TMEM64 family)